MPKELPPEEGTTEAEDAEAEAAVEDAEAAAEEEERRDSLIDSPLKLETDDLKKLKRKHSRHHHRRKYSLQEGGAHRQRVRAGSDFGVPTTRRISIQPEEASTLQEQDIDDLTSM